MQDTLVVSMRERVERALAMCRPYLQIDKGDVELLNVTNDGIVELRFLGTCTICPMSRMTLRAGIERVILHMVPEVTRVEEQR